MNQHPLRKGYSRISQKERLGIFTLLLVSVVCAAAPLVFEHHNPRIITEDSAFLAEVNAFRIQLARAESKTTLKKKWVRRDTGIARAYVRKVLLIDINKADSAAWEALPGIGPVLAARIVRFRERLGGFYAVTQVAETYGLPDSTFNKIQPSLQLRKVSLKKIDINQTDEKTLAQHPYIRYKLARIIVLYRSNNGPFKGPEQLLDIPLVDDSIYRKLEHYIKTENSPL